MATLRTRPAVCVVLALLGSSGPGSAEDWPTKPVRMMVPYAAGGNTDIVARLIAQRLAGAFGPQFVVENRAGAAGALAAEAVARAPADGHTLFVATLPQIAIAPAMTKTPYDPVKDFAPISNIGTNPFVLVVHPSVPAATVGELVDYARAHPNKLTYAASGVGSVSYLSIVLFLKLAALDMVPVMYKGGTAPQADVIAGHVQVYITSLSGVAQYGASSALRLLAVTGPTRAPQIPHVPTFVESGYEGLNILNWTGLMAPARTPKEVVDRIAKAVALAVRDAKTAEMLEANGVQPLGNSPEEFTAEIAADIALWADAVKLTGISEK